MNLTRGSLAPARVGKVVAAVLVGLGIGALVPPDPVVVPGAGSLPGVVVGTVGVAAGVGLFLGVRRSGSDCGCAGDCGC